MTVIAVSHPLPSMWPPRAIELWCEDTQALSSHISTPPRRRAKRGLAEMDDTTLEEDNVNDAGRPHGREEEVPRQHPSSSVALLPGPAYQSRPTCPVESASVSSTTNTESTESTESTASKKRKRRASLSIRLLEVAQYA